MFQQTCSAILLTLALSSTAQCQNSGQQFDLTGMPPCDALINASLHDRLLLPSNASYAPAIDTWWSMSSRQTPWCILRPESTQEVSTALTALVEAGDGAGDWHVALRSGGHMASAGTNNIDNGVTIDLSYLNQSTYDDDTKLASVEPGARWKDVYADLLEYNVTVSGGRDGGVGVGGYLLGGGISFYAAQTGFSCNFVENFEVVLANGSIINADRNENPDLWKALKGGGSNFGIVTRFDLKTLPATNLSYTSKVLSSNYSDSFIDGLIDFNQASNRAPYDAAIPFYTHSPTMNGSETAITLIEVNLRGDSNSATFDQLNQIPAVSSTHKNVSLAEAAAGSQVAGGTWNAGFSLTFRNDPTIMRYAAKLHDKYVKSLSSSIGSENFTTYLFFEPIPSIVGQTGLEQGGNMLSLPPGENVIIMDGGVGVSTNAADLAFAHEGMLAMSSSIDSFAKKQGGYVDLVYANYADTTQDPLGSYSEENKNFMREVAAKYDPDGVFQTMIPGGFKISRVH